MNLKIRAFGISKEIVGGREIEFQVNGETISELRKELNAKFPALLDLNSLFIAVNNRYTEEEAIIKESDEIALIPPVSGG